VNEKVDGVKDGREAATHPTPNKPVFKPFEAFLPGHQKVLIPAIEKAVKNPELKGKIW
jgi:hypothetical protein